MKLLPAIALAALFPIVGFQALSAATPSQVYTEVGKQLGSYKSLEYTYELKKGEEPFQVKAWFEDGVFRRVKASQAGDGGVLTRDFYYDEEGVLRFVLGTLAGEAQGLKPAVAAEERFEFEDEKLVRYTGPDKKPVAPDDKKFAEMSKALAAMSADLMERIEGSTAYVGMVGGVDDPNKPKVAPNTIFGAGYADGTFSQIEEADYFHLDILEADGEIETFFVITADKSVEPFLKDSEKQKGKKIRVHWTEKMQPIPEAGGATRLKICDRIELLK